jgi:hypothetical protein
MKKISLLSLLTVLLLISSVCFSQEKTGQVYFIRATGYVSSAVNFRVYLDDSLVCKLKNKTYSVHTVKAGKHTVRAANTGLSSHKKSAPFEVEVKEGQTTYVDVVWANTVSCQEITANSAQSKLKGIKQATNCSSND